MVTTPGSATCTTTVAMSTGPTTISQLVPPFAASWIDYLKESLAGASVFHFNICIYNIKMKMEEKIRKSNY
jgi:hypothetical protein